MLDAASERAEKVLRAATTTTVPADYFEQLHRALDEPPAPDPALQRAARRARRAPKRDSTWRWVVVAEEVFEADLPLPNVASMQTRPARLDRREVDLRRLVSGFLRMAPDIAVVGEVRDREGYPETFTDGVGR